MTAVLYAGGLRIHGFHGFHFPDSPRKCLPTLRYGTVRYRIVPYRTVPYCYLLLYKVQYCTVQPYRTVRYKYVLTATVNPLFDMLYCVVPYYTVYGIVAREDFNSKELGINIKSFSGRKLKSLSCILVYIF